MTVPADAYQPASRRFPRKLVDSRAPAMEPDVIYRLDKSIARPIAGPSLSSCSEAFGSSVGYASLVVRRAGASCAVLRRHHGRHA
jgi:hypothetical protein